MSLHSLLHGQPLPFSNDRPATIPWQADESGRHYRLLRLRTQEAGIVEMGGVYLLWHQGQKPQWIYIGQTYDLADAIESARDSSAILNYEAVGGIYVTWAPVKEEYRDGVVRFLKSALKPAIDEDLDGGLDRTADPIAVVPPI